VSAEGFSHPGVCVVAHNFIQFQHGMTFPKVIQCFGLEAAFVDALNRA